MGGIFVVEGMTLRISNLAIHVGEDDNVTMEPDLTIAFDACIVWAKIALEHRDTAKAKLKTRRAVWSSEEFDEDQRGRSLEEEFHATMQAVVASVICIDALYDHLLPYAPITTEAKEAWFRKKTSRHKRIAETIRTTFAIKPEQMKALRSNFHSMFTLRDAAVHPSSTPRQPYPHPELPISTEWRLTAFRGDVADIFVCFAVGLLWDVTRGTKYRTPELTEFIQQFRRRVDCLLPDGKPLPSDPSVTYTIPRRSGHKSGI